MANEVTETQKKTRALINVKCDPSLKARFDAHLVQAGFRGITDALLTFVRDFLAGRIQYKDGILQHQGKNSPI